MDKPKTKISQRQKLYFIYFIMFTIIVLIVFAIIIIGTFWDYHAELKNMEKFYRDRLERLTKASPVINRYDPIKGDISAKVTIYEFSDFTCQSCKKIQADLISLEKYFGKKIRFVFKGIPVTIHPETRPALEAAYCAAEQNKFWEYKSLLYQDNLPLNLQTYRQYASQIFLDLDAFNQCLDSDKYQTVIDQNLVQALSLEVTSVPTIYINNQKLEGYINFTTLKNVVEQHLLY